MYFVVAKQSQVHQCATTASGLCFDKHNQHSPSVGMVSWLDSPQAQCLEHSDVLGSIEDDQGLSDAPTL